jgi:hypothetical protein
MANLLVSFVIISIGNTIFLKIYPSTNPTMSSYAFMIGKIVNPLLALPFSQCLGLLS